MRELVAQMREVGAAPGDLLDDPSSAILEIDRQALYIPSSAGIQVLDRYQPASGEYYRVEAVKSRRYPAVDLVIVGEDTRTR